jgi:hypothetical protein
VLQHLLTHRLDEQELLSISRTATYAKFNAVTLQTKPDSIFLRTTETEKSHPLVLFLLNHLELCCKKLKIMLWNAPNAYPYVQPGGLAELGEILQNHQVILVLQE